MGRAEGEISTWIAGWARRAGGAIALRFEGQDISYAAFEQRVARLAGAPSRRAGISAGDRVAYLGQNTPVLLELLFACARIGAILVPLSARMPAPELTVVLANTEPVALLAGADLAQTAREAASELEPKVIAFGGADGADGALAALLAGAPELRCDPARPLSTPLAIVNTSGTTGPTKGAVLTHEMLHFNALNVAAAVGVGPGDEVLTNGPLFNTGPLNILATPALAAGATVTIQREFEPGAMLEEIERRQITLAISAPAMTKALISHPRWDSTDLSSLRCVITGSAIVREDVARAVVRARRRRARAPGRRARRGAGRFVVLQPAETLSADDVKGLFAGRLADYKHPRDVVFVDALPRSAIGKVQADELRRSLRV